MSEDLIDPKKLYDHIISSREILCRYSNVGTINSSEVSDYLSDTRPDRLLLRNVAENHILKREVRKSSGKNKWQKIKDVLFNRDGLDDLAEARNIITDTTNKILILMHKNIILEDAVQYVERSYGLQNSVKGLSSHEMINKTYVQCRDICSRALDNVRKVKS